MLEIVESLKLFSGELGVYGVSGYMIAMWVIAIVLLYMGVAKGFEPLLMVPIAFGAFLANIPDNGMLVTKVPTMNSDNKVITETMYLRAKLSWPTEQGWGQTTVKEGVYDKTNHNKTLLKDANGELVTQERSTAQVRIDSIQGGLFDFLGQGVKAEIFPPIIFLGVGALTDFGPLIAAPRTLLLGAAAQCGVAFTFFMAIFLGFNPNEAASIGIIGGADGPTSIFLTNKLAPHLLGAVAVAAYTYMALVPLIQPPIMRLLTTKTQRKIKMKSLRTVSKTEKLIFCFLVALISILLVPDASALIGMLMLGNFFRECKMTERLVLSAQNEIINVTTIFLGVSVGLTMQGERFLQFETIKIIFLGIIAFAVATACGVLCAQLMNLVWRKNPVNPLIGSAGVSAVPMAARVSHTEGQKADPTNYLLMHAMGPNVAGVIGTAVIAGYYIATLGH